MSLPLCTIGDAMLEVIGLNPQAFKGASEARWAAHDVWDEEPFYQPTAQGERSQTLRLAARPHVMGGLDQYAILFRHHQERDVVPFMRLLGSASAFPIGRFIGDVGVQEVSESEEKLAPGGLGRRWEFDVKLLFVGRRAGGF